MPALGLLRLLPFLGIALLLAWGMRVDHLRAGWKEIVETSLVAARDAVGDQNLKAENMSGALAVLADEKKAVVKAVQGAVDDPTVRVTWDVAAEQINELGKGKRAVRIELDQVNLRIDEMARKAIAAEESRDNLRKLLKKAEERREYARRELSKVNISKEQTEACLELDREARRAANALREAGI